MTCIVKRNDLISYFPVFRYNLQCFKFYFLLILLRFYMMSQTMRHLCKNFHFCILSCVKVRKKKNITLIFGEQCALNATNDLNWILIILFLFLYAGKQT